MYGLLFLSRYFIALLCSVTGVSNADIDIARQNGYCGCFAEQHYVCKLLAVNASFPCSCFVDICTLQRHAGHVTLTKDLLYEGDCYMHA